MKSAKSLLTLLLLFLYSSSFGGKIEKAFEKLKIYDYFNAKNYFEDSYKNETSAAAFGLAIIYSRNDNPFYNLDSARKFILVSDSSYRMLKGKTKIKYQDFGISDSSLINLSDKICEMGFQRAKANGTVESFNNYLANFSTCNRYSEAYLLRDSAAFDDASEANTSSAFKEFMVLYPQAKQYASALDKFEECLYKENTKDGTLEAYDKFIQNFPENRYRDDAEKRIYELSVPDKSIEQYVTFARKYRNTAYAKAAWREMYKISMRDFTMESYNNFKDSFPDYPFQEEFENDFKLQNFIFLPFKEDGHWGYINENGKEMIEPVYDEASLFSDGFAAVLQKGLYGYINKSGNVTINFRYKDAEPYHNGFAIVMKDSLYGLINKNGDIIIQFLYDELVETENEIYIGAKKDKYGYIRKNGVPLTAFIFDLANDFKRGFAIVSKDEKFGTINKDGQYVIPPVYDEIVYISDALYKARNEQDLWGILNTVGDTILPFSYQAIGEFNDHLALVAKGGKCGYIDESGLIKIPLKFFYASSLLTTAQFQNGYALIQQQAKAVLIDSVGNILKFKGYDDYQRPSFGFVAVRKAGKWGFADMTGRLVIPFLYQSVGAFNDTLALVKKGNVYGLIDTTGKLFIQPIYQDIKILPKAIQVQSGNKWGLLSRAGTLYIPCNYDQIEVLNPELIRAADKRGFTYINLQNGKIIFSPRD